MIQTTKPLMLKLQGGSFLNANLVRHASKDEETDRCQVSYIDEYGSEQWRGITKETYELLTDSSAQPSKLDMQG